MQEFLEFVLGRLIDFPDEMVITRHEEGRHLLFRVALRQSDVGKVVGKHGITIDSIRNLLATAGARHGQKVSFEIEGEAARGIPPQSVPRE